MHSLGVSFGFLGRKPQRAAGCLVLARDGDPRFVGTANASHTLKTLTGTESSYTGQDFIGAGPGLHPLCLLQQLFNGWIWNGHGHERGDWRIVIGFENAVVGAAAGALAC